MAEQILYSNITLSSTLDSMYRGLSGLYDFALTSVEKDKAISAAIEAIQIQTGDSGSIKASIDALSTALRAAIDQQIKDRADRDTQIEQSAKNYTDTILKSYYTKDQIDTISGVLEDYTDNAVSSKLDKTQFTNTIANYKTATATTSEISAAVEKESNRAKAAQAELSDSITNKVELLTEYIDQQAAKVFRWKGTKATKAELDATSGVVGDVWQVGTTEYVYNGVVWQELGLNIDISAYATNEALNKAKTQLSTAIQAEAQTRTQAINQITQQINNINQLIGGTDGNGKSLTNRVTAIENIIPTSSATAGTLLVEKNGKIALNDSYNPGIALQFNGKSVGSGITSLNFAGTTTITVGDDGVAKIQIGENMNTSVWNAKDGKQGDGTPSGFPAGASIIIPDASGAAFKTGDWTAGSTLAVGTTAGSVTVKSTGKIHLDEGLNTWTVKVYGATKNVLVEANVTDTVKYNNQANPTSATVTASAVSYVTGTSGVTHSVSSGGLQPNYPAAVGGCAIVSFTFDLTKINEIKNGGRYSIEIIGCGGTYKSAERFYVKESTPTIASATLTFNNDPSTKKISGVEYIKAGTFTVETGNITNLNNQAGVATRLKATSNDFSDEDTSIISSELIGFTNAWNNICTYKDTGLTLGSNLSKVGTNLLITLTPYNAKATGTAVSATLGGFNINTYAETNSSTSAETFLVENMRLNNDLTAWDSAATLDAEDLQVIPGTGLVYPTTNYSAVALPANNPNYSNLTGTRYFTRHMTPSATGTKFGGTLTLQGLGNNWSKLTFAKLSIDNGATWFNLKADRGGADATGILNSYTSSSGAISFSFPGTTSTDASKGVYIKLGWSDTTVKITKITLSM